MLYDEAHIERCLQKDVVVLAFLLHCIHLKQNFQKYIRHLPEYITNTTDRLNNNSYPPFNAICKWKTNCAIVDHSKHTYDRQYEFDIILYWVHNIKLNNKTQLTSGEVQNKLLSHRVHFTHDKLSHATDFCF